jgi:hypothetical protein
MKLQTKHVRELIISEDEFLKACEYVMQQQSTITNSFIGSYEQPSARRFAQALQYYLFTGDGE